VPELPEVETIARGLANAVVGKTIADAVVSMAKIAVAPPGVSFIETLRGERIEAVGRRGKYIVVQLGSGRRLTVHLRMTGRLIVQAPEVSEPHPYTHIRLTFTDGWRLCFADVRQFGRMRLLAVEEVWDADGGVEPLSKDFTSEVFVSMLDGRRTPIKTFLLDQKHISGVGNIYACEALWEAGIRPNRPAWKISRPARRRLHGASKPP
jgi:formamidopyrimidine-DNA glycosylase